ncbi:proline-rich protein 19 isoform X2 [Anser cygnoides]|uniref:proline-rich protein 19 isoform X2 n=1 Tax=Anser cygnoides TaxID=8845 RepID=UPI0034D23F88
MSAMSHGSGRGDARGAARDAQAPPGRVKRRRTRGERNRTKFGRCLPSSTRRQGPRPPWGGVPPLRAAPPQPSPLPPPRPVIITQQRLSRPRGLLGRGVTSGDIQRLLGGGQGAGPPPAEGLGWPAGSPLPAQGLGRDGRGSPPQPQVPRGPGREDGGSAPRTGTPPQEVAGRLRALLPAPAELWGRALAEERRRAVLAALLERHCALPDLAALLPPRGVGAAGGLSHGLPPPGPPPASPPSPGLSTPEMEPLPQAVRSKDPAAHRSHPPAPLQAVTQSCFPWMMEDEDEAHSEKPAMQFCVRTPSPPLFRARHPAPSPASYLPAGRCTPEPELLPQPTTSKNPAPQHRWHRVSPQAVDQTPSPPAVPLPPVFGAKRKERQSWLPWMSEDEDDTHPEDPAPLFCARTPSPPLFEGLPQPHIPLGEPGCTCRAAWGPRVEDKAEGHGQIYWRSRVPQHRQVLEHPMSGTHAPHHPCWCHRDQRTPPTLYRGTCPCAPSPSHHPCKHSPCPHSRPRHATSFPTCRCSPRESHRPRGWRGPLEPRQRGWHLSFCPHATVPHNVRERDSSPNVWLFPCLY